MSKPIAPVGDLKPASWAICKTAETGADDLRIATKYLNEPRGKILAVLVPLKVEDL